MAEEETPIATMSFEQALDELERVVTRLERSDVPLEESLSLFARGAALRDRCEAQLRAAEARVEAITKNFDGSVQARPVDTP